MRFSSLISLIRNLLQICNQTERKSVYLLLVMMIIGAGLEVLGIGLIIPFIGLLTDPDIVNKNRFLAYAYEYQNMGSINEFIFFLGVCLIGIYIVKNLYLAFLAYVQSVFLFNKQARMARNLLHLYMRKPYTFHLQRDTSELLRNITTEAINVANGIMLPTLLLLTEAIVLLFIVFFLFYMEPLVALAATLYMMFLGIVIFSLLGGALTRHGLQRQKYAGEMIKWINQGLLGIKESKILGKEKFFVDSYFEKSQHYVKSARVYAVLSITPRLVLETGAVVMMLLVVLWVITQDADTNKAVSILVLFAVALIRMLPSVNRLTTSVNTIKYFYPALATYQEESNTDQPDLETHTVEAAEINFQDSIKLENVSYRYTDSDSNVLDNICLGIRKGSSVAFVGPSGAGKSTLVDMIIGLHTPTKGNILIDGNELDSVQVAWQRNIGYVPQSIFLIDGTIRQNIAFGVDDNEIDEQRVIESLRMAQLAGKILGLSGGLDTLVGENGIRLSGGERQRIGIARALYNNPDVLVLDEATSSLDQETENALSETVRSLFGRKTVIIIAHRLSTVKYCDNIVLLKEGKIAASGSYDDLKKNNDDFRIMVETQRL